MIYMIDYVCIYIYTICMRITAFFILLRYNVCACFLSAEVNNSRSCQQLRQLSPVDDEVASNG